MKVRVFVGYTKISYSCVHAFLCNYIISISLLKYIYSLILFYFLLFRFLVLFFILFFTFCFLKFFR
ncbi:hypothetical protein GLOIN_2v1495723 [Rhizophagus irregularis DAOM 181602=DAOM 197198]|uniref:Uncharacterized protein n=1 Tax=Rhizophagus irregularis (strain DAOM 181602 / DAOM 197198 / MUCL 43194) TaxID=747089 RepID=A0A2P4QY11_RHIID|nr:hypothetical protein GLOIN_2v1495723 [Rhizophagus irregularis DAOM 181602=DAOM 197198]POG82517.1 hypothetical protein GLOIN_2v1495723 [Rhizophagus irregularis DAOM 181602=DAOM 197198]|eukprot:XP_025189383.1 hypothetical protein GLOIN_2v1495723 [Rhizophagus irregularis DAOM 181602=DAOM 197198]